MLAFFAEDGAFCKVLGIPSLNSGFACGSCHLPQRFCCGLAEVHALCKFSRIVLPTSKPSAGFPRLTCRRRRLPQVCADLLAVVAGFCKFLPILLQRTSSYARFLRSTCRGPRPLQ